MNRIKITHYSDALCVWAYVSQVRLDELQANFGAAVELEYRYFHVFGHVHKKIESAWQARGGRPAYREHVRGVIDQFGHVILHPEVWAHTVPSSSMPSHLFLCAVRCLENDGQMSPGATGRTAWALREAFFKEGRDIAQREVLFAVAEALALPLTSLEHALADGTAHAVLCEDLDLARTQAIAASPTLLFNEGRQRLTGNVGYRIIEANIRELLEGAPGQLSWC